ncbi:MAG: VCBS repeat-containing protein [Fuerstiella sp.]|nr:VCBS repeat-containing protein [Fuerstiella sp.]
MKRKITFLSLVLVVLAGLVAFGVLWTRQTAEPQRETVHSPLTGNGASAARVTQVTEESPIRFTDVTQQSGIVFRYYGAPTPEHNMIEQNGGGVALLDLDGDSVLDVFLVNGSQFAATAETVGASNQIFRATAEGAYDDVTTVSGLQAFGFGMGCAVGDYNNDGFSDVYVTCYGRNRMWQNNGDGTYHEITMQAGVDNELWGTSAAFADLDADGLLDLYVVNYVTWNAAEPPCFSIGEPKVRIVCGASNHPGQPDILYRNLGQGEFEDVGVTAGISIKDKGKGLAVAIADFDHDHRPDIFVANDTTGNFLFQNMGEMTFKEVGIQRGVAFNGMGELGAGMGVGCADYDRDGRLDLCVSNFRHQVNDVFANLGEAGFVATTSDVGVDQMSMLPLSFGILLKDFDLDGWADMFVANGHIWDLSSVSQHSEYKMLPQLLLNRNGQRFVDATQSAGEYFRTPALGRAVAAGDLDNDGDTDLVVTHIDQNVVVLRNDSERAGPSLRIRLIGTQSSRQPFGVRVEARLGSTRFVTHVPAGESFQADHDDRLLIPLGEATRIDEFRVFWPHGRIETWRNLSTRSSLNLREGTGETVLSDK